ncbi:MAG TPA: sulfite exporter TauE/SafE family protein [Acidimicrobiales bacterium]
MSPGEALAILAAGLAAGTINTIVGSGSLITFPTLLAVGYAPVVANVSNTIGLVTGSISGAVGYRHELVGQAGRVRALAIAAVAGGLTGGVLLLVLPGSVFRGVVPVLILLACVLVAIQPRLARRAAERPRRAHGGPWLLLTIFTTGIYGGYFGAAQGVLFIALLGIFLDDSLQRLNGLKNVLAAFVNGVAALLFIVAADVAWEAAGLLAAGAVVGGQVGAKVGRRIPAPWLRAVIVVVGTIVAVKLLIDQ